MPAKTPDQLKARAAALRKKFADKGKSMDGTQVREIKKKIRRVQRKRRRIVAPKRRPKPGEEKKG